MAVLKPVRLDEVWSSANPTGVIYPGFNKVVAGWDLEIPNYQHFNYILSLMSQYANYANVRGLGDWDLNTEYEEDSYVQHNGLIWKGLKITQNVEPGTDNTAWKNADAISLVTTHENRQDNPHVVTKTQVGLGNVVNIDYGTTGKVVNSAQADNSTLFDNAVKDTSTTLATATDLKVPTSLAVKTFVGSSILPVQNQLDLLEDRVDSITLPIGTMLMYSGVGWVDDETLPGWYACTAANVAQGVPDLVGKFIYGGESAGLTGGANSLILTTSNLPTHKHTASHNHSASSSSTGAHTHTIYKGNSNSNTITGGIGFDNPSFNAQSGSAGNHSHSITVNTKTMDTLDAGSSSAFDNRPAFYTSIFIQRVS